MANKTSVIVEVRGGNVVGVVSDRSVNVYVVDHDTQGLSDDLLVNFPLKKGQTERVRMEYMTPADRSPGFVGAVLKMWGLRR